LGSKEEILLGGQALNPIGGTKALNSTRQLLLRPKCIASTAYTGSLAVTTYLD